MRLNFKATSGQRRPGWSRVRQQLVSPSAHVSLDRPAHVVWRIARLQAGVSVLTSSVVIVLGLIALALPDHDRAPVILLVALFAVAGGVLVAITDRWLGRGLDGLVRSGAQLRQSAAERAAELARVNAEMRRRDGERGELYATMTHELRTPLNAIIGHSRLLLDDLDGELNDEQRTDVRQIHDGGLGLLRIVNGALDLARLEAGAAEWERASVQVWAVAEEVVALLRPLAEARQLDLISTIGPSVPPVLADEERLRQVLVNLVGNAVKFTPSGKVQLFVQAVGDVVTIVVKDTGIGIADEARDQVFEPFRQGQQGTARSHDGTGLGLAITRRLVELMGGRIWVESVHGAGSAFYVSLPRAEEPPAVRDAWTDELEAREPVDVALVGDDTAAGELATVLADQGIAARHFAGPDWEHSVMRVSPRLVLVDAQQPRAGTWRMLLAASRQPRLAGVRLGLLGVASQAGTYIGNVLVLPNLSVVASADLSEALLGLLGEATTDSRVPVIALSSDADWRNRVTTLAQRLGVGVYETGHGDAALAVARRSSVSAVVIDLVVGGPGIAELLAEFQAALGRRDCPIFVVAPDGLSPSEQRNLRLGALSWLAADACPLPSLAREIVEQLAAPKPDLVTAGGR